MTRRYKRRPINRNLAPDEWFEERERRAQSPTTLNNQLGRAIKSRLIRCLIERRLSIRQTAVELDVTPKRVRRWAKKLGVPLPTSRQFPGSRNGNLKSSAIVTPGRKQTEGLTATSATHKDQNRRIEATLAAKPVGKEARASEEQKGDSQQGDIEKIFQQGREEMSARENERIQAARDEKFFGR